MQILKVQCFFIFIVCAYCHDRHPKHILVAPTQFISGASNKVCISRFGSATYGKAVAQVELLKYLSNDEEQNGNQKSKYIARTKKTFPDGNGGCLDIFVPRTIYKRALLHLKMRFDKLESYQVNTKKNVYIQHNANLILIRMDKSVYRAGETVKFRIIQLKNDLTPLNSPVYKVFIETPPDLFGGSTKTIEWSNITTQLGIVQKEYKLDKYAQKGDWRIVVESRGPNPVTTEKSFLVTEYTLPSFNVILHYKKNIYTESTEATWQICVLYVHKEPVRGSLYTKIHTDLSYYPPIYNELKMNGTYPCTNHTISAQDLKLNELFDRRPKVIIAEISFQENLSKIWKNTTAISYTQDHLARIEYLNEKYLQLIPGTPIELNLKVLDLNDAIINGAKLKLCSKPELYNESFAATSNIHNEQCEYVISDERGIGLFILNVPNDSEGMLLSAFIENLPMQNKNFNKNSTKATLKLKVMNSTIGTHMNIGSPKMSNQPSHIDIPIYLKFSSNTIIKRITFHYMIITRAGILQHWGISSQCINPIHSTQHIQDNLSPSYSETECTDDESHSNLYLALLRIKISHLMCPYSHLILYFMSSEGNLIISSKYIQLETCFSNEITQNWTPSTVIPGAIANISLKSSKTVGPSLCLLESTNVALKSVSPQSSLQDEILNEINNFMEARVKKNRMINGNRCTKEGNSQKNKEEITFGDMIPFLDDIGVTLITDFSIVSQDECPESIYQIERPNIIYKETYERVFFPETWLWETFLMDSNKIINIPVTVPDDVTIWETNVFCISRSGVAPSTRNYLKVFKPLFIDFSSPKSIKRLEENELNFKIYNYADDPISIEINLSTSPPEVANIFFSETKKFACIQNRSIEIFHFDVVGVTLESFNLTIKVSTTRDNNSCNDNQPFTKISDTIVKQIWIESEGFSVINYKSALFCNMNGASKQIETIWDFDKSDFINGSEKLIISSVGDIAGPMKINVKNLIELPMGCGEQNMVLLAYNLVALEYSISQKRVFGEMKDIAIENLSSGYQRQLRFRHLKSGAFSAFGNADEIGSTWLTAFCVKYLSAMHSKWKIGNIKIINEAIQWLQSVQLENGCFSNEGQIFHRKMMGGLNSDTSNIALTAYIAVALIEANTPLLKPSDVDNMVFCLGALDFKDSSYDYINSYDETPPEEPQFIYAFALSTYALLKIEKYSTYKNNTYTSMDILSKKTNSYLANGGSGALLRLKRMAKRNGNFMWWEGVSLADSIEITAYGILCLLEDTGDNTEEALAAARWLSMHRNQEGGFISTQDTLIATQSLIALRNSIPDISPTMNITFESQNQIDHIYVTPQTRYNLQTIVITPANQTNMTETNLKIRIDGEGCVLVQATHKYNQPTNARQLSPFRLYANVATHGVFSCEHEVHCKCAAVLEVCFSWNDPAKESMPKMMLIEIRLPTGYRPDRFLLYSLIKPENPLLKKIEEAEDSNTIYLYLYQTTIQFSQNLKGCYNLFLIGPKTFTIPAVIKIFDYYEQQVFQSIMYNIPESCSNDGVLMHDEPLNVSISQPDDNVNTGGFELIQTYSPDDGKDRFVNWTVINSEQDLDVPDGNEGYHETWVPG